MSDVTLKLKWSQRPPSVRLAVPWSGTVAPCQFVPFEGRNVVPLIVSASSGQTWPSLTTRSMLTVPLA
jgi:hypothetical protein